MGFDRCEIAHLTSVPLVSFFQSPSSSFLIHHLQKMADVQVVSSIQATVALGQKLASLLQTLIELNPSSQGDLKDFHYDVEATSGTLRQLEDLMSLDEAIRFERNTKPAVTSLYLDEIETLAVRCGLIYKSIILITQKAGVRGSSKDGSDEASSIENLKNELLTGPIPDPGSIKSIKLVRVPAKYEQKEWLEPRFDRCQEQLQWIRTGLLIHLHIFKLAQLQNGYGPSRDPLVLHSSYCIQLIARADLSSATQATLRMSSCTEVPSSCCDGGRSSSPRRRPRSRKKRNDNGNYGEMTKAPRPRRSQATQALYTLRPLPAQPSTMKLPSRGKSRTLKNPRIQVRNPNHSSGDHSS